MPLRDILQKKDRLGDTANSSVPEITFIRSDTVSHEVITPPTIHDHSHDHDDGSRPPSASSHRRSLNPFSRSRATSDASPTTSTSPVRPRRERGLSQLLHLDRPRSPRTSSSPSANIPADLPQIVSGQESSEQDREAQWERRATLLVQHSHSNPHLRAAANNALSPGSSPQGGGNHARSRSRSSSQSGINDPEGDVNIQEAIRLHETGDLENSTAMFRRLADPNGANNALSQVLYALALRHGWGCPIDTETAVFYLSAAASNSASIETQALQAGLKKGGAAKGELVLAIFELGNCFRNGWGVQKDPVAARQYFETAANLGDTDAMNEVAWCYLEGFGGKKDKFTAAKYYRLAEQKGSKTVGNSWIWKEKYDS